MSKSLIGLVRDYRLAEEHIANAIYDLSMAKVDGLKQVGEREVSILLPKLRRMQAELYVSDAWIIELESYFGDLDERDLHNDRHWPELK